ncbi:unnamed protein product [Ophioblennius macclurei]
MSIIQLQISLNESEEKQLASEGYKRIPGYLTKAAGNNKVLLWARYGSDWCITRIQVSYTDEMAKCLSDAGYVRIDKNINTITAREEIYIWFYRGTTNSDVPIEDILISTDANSEAEMFKLGFEKVTFNLAPWLGGCNVYLWLKREVPIYISDITATSDWSTVPELLRKGYTRIDDYINKYVNEDRVYLWYLRTADEMKAIGDMQLSKTAEQYFDFQKQGYTVVNMNLNWGTKRPQMFLWYKKNEKRIKVMGIITKRDYKAYKQIGATLIEMFTVFSLIEEPTYYLAFCT